MTQLAAKLLAEAPHLPDGERGELAAKLIESLESEVDEEVEAAWSAEIRQRLEDLRTNKVKPVSWLEARQMIMDDTDDAAST